MSNPDVEIFHFNNNKIPKATESKETSTKKIVSWGEGAYYNKYPEYLLELYNNSPVHASIINAKANYIIGEGLKYISGKDLNFMVNAEDSLNDFIRKIVVDFSIYGAFAVEVNYDMSSMKPTPHNYFHIPFYKIRRNKEKTIVAYAEEWGFKTKPDWQTDRFRPNSADTTSKVFVFDGYHSSTNSVYPTPEYASAIEAIHIDVQTRKFHRNQLDNSFSPSHILSFKNGAYSTIEKKAELMKKVKDSYTGANGAKLIIEFLDASTSEAASVQTLSAGDWDKAYEIVAKKAMDDIMIAHNVVSPSLFGVKLEGQLGGASELEVSHEIFKDNYVRPKRNELESALNYLFLDSPKIVEKVEFKDRVLFNAKLSDTTKEKIYTINELRAIEGKAPVANGDRLLGEPIQENNPSTFSQDYHHLSDDDFEKIKDMGLLWDEFELIESGEAITSQEDFNKVELKFETSQEIADYLINKQVQGKSIAEIKVEIRKELGVNITSRELESTLKNLADAGVANIEVQDGKINVRPVAEDAPKRKIEVMYSYEVRKGMGEPIIDTTRPFCKKLIQNGRLYTREEIQTMTSIFGYDIFKYGGGWHLDKQSGVRTKHCRHEFVSKTVSRKLK